MKQATEGLRQRMLVVIGAGNAQWDNQGERQILSAYTPLGFTARVDQIAVETGMSRSEVLNALLFIGESTLTAKN